VNARWSSPLWRDGVRILLMSAWGVGALALAPDAAAAQTVIQQRQLEYESARAFLDAHRRNWEVREQVWYSWLDSTLAAEQLGDINRLDAAERRVLSEAMELGRLGRLVDDAKADLSTKRRGFQDALEAEIDRLLGQLQRARSATERGDLTRQIDSHEALAAQLRTEESELDPLTFLYVRLSAPPPGMGAAGINRMIDLANRRISDAEEWITRVQARIGSLERQQRLTRQAGDAATSLNRFGSGDLVGARTRETSSAQVAAPLTVDEELEQLRTQLGLLQSMRAQLQAYAAGLRGRIPTGGGNQ
jgi:hypothetical protein